MPTLADFKEDTSPSGFVAAPDERPDLTKHDPNTFAALTGQDYLKTLAAQGLMPVADDVKAVEAKALDTAINFHKSVAEGQAAANTELKKRIAAVTPSFTKDGVRIPSLTEQEEQQKALVEVQKQQAEQQWGQGASAVAAAQAQPGGIVAGKVSAMTDEQSNKFASYLEGGHNIQNLADLFDQMANSGGVGQGGVLHSGLGLLTPIGNLTSPQARIYHAYAESSVIPLAKGLMGDAATTAGRPDVSAKMLDAMPNAQDNVQSGGQKIYMMLDRNINNLQTERDLLRKRGVDTSPVDSQILDLQSYINRPSIAKYNPKTQQPVVQVGTSDQANATTANVNAGANAGVQAPQAVPGAGTYNFGQGGSANDVTPQAGQPTPQQVAASAQRDQQFQQRTTAVNKTLGNQFNRSIQDTGTQLQAVGGAVSNARQWLANLLPENWDANSFQSQQQPPNSQGTTGSW